MSSTRLGTRITRRALALTATSAGVTAVLVACGPTRPPGEQPEAAATQGPQAGATTAPSSQGTAARNRTLIIGFEGGSVQAPEVANPYVPGAAISQGYHQLMIESLFYLNYETGKAVPWLAESADYNRDHTAVDIKLRRGVEWSDGTPFTAEDVAFTLNVLRESSAASLAYGPEMNRWVKGVEVVDSQTVHVDLTEPYPRFIFNNFSVHIWGAVRILPKHIWEGKDPKTFTNFDPSRGWPVWTGPYKLVKASSDEFVYDRRDDWWAKKIGFSELPAPERVVFVEAGLDDKKAAALEANDVDGEPSLKLDTYLAVRKRNRHAIGWLDQEPFGWVDPCPPILGFNCQQPPWDDREMRWAVNYAIDKKKVANIFGLGHGIPARYNFPAYPPLEGLLDENKDLFQKYPAMEYNPKKATEIFEKKGYKRGGDGIYAKDGRRLQVDLLVKAESPDIPPLVLAFLRAVGIDAVPKVLANAQYSDLRNRADFQMEATHVACGSTVDPFGDVNLFHSRWLRPRGEIRSNNVWSYADPEYDQVADKIALLPPGDPGLKPLFRQALEIRLRDLPVIAMAQQIRVVPYSTRYWTNWPTQKNNYFHPPNWWMTFLMTVLQLKPAG